MSGNTSMESTQQDSGMIAIATAINKLADAVTAFTIASNGGDASAEEKKGRKRQDSQVTVSQELATFIGVDVGAPITRQEASAMVMQYVKSNDLQDPSDRRKIVPDAALAALLGSGDVVNVLNLKSSLKDHFSAI